VYFRNFNHPDVKSRLKAKGTKEHKEMVEVQEFHHPPVVGQAKRDKRTQRRLRKYRALTLFAAGRHKRYNPAADFQEMDYHFMTY